VALSRKRDEVDPSKIVAYLRVSSQEQADSGLGLAAQRSAVEGEAARRAWKIVAWHEDAGLSGKSLKRPALAAARADVEEGRAAALVVAKLDRLSRSLLDFASLMESARAGGWGLVASTCKWTPQRPAAR
jgi:DNA invertase Pin-like site-specific DNA recombinase